MRIWGQGEVGEVTSGQVPEEHQGTHLLSFVINNNTYVRSARLFQRRKSTIPTYTHDDIFVASFHSGEIVRPQVNLFFSLIKKHTKAKHSC